jgi:transcriptional regulator with XRE-family HTH domain
VIDMELLSVIRRWRYRDHFSIREISRRTGLSRNTVRKYLRSDTVEPKFNVADRPSKLDPYADKLSQMLRQEAGKSRKQKRTTKQLHADLTALGYDGSYNRVAAFARDWKAARQIVCEHRHLLAPRPSRRKVPLLGAQAGLQRRCCGGFLRGSPVSLRTRQSSGVQISLDDARAAPHAPLDES